MKSLVAAFDCNLSSPWLVFDIGETRRGWCVL